MLVERIINKIINEKIDIDKILIVTFTNAAASEMRQKILDAIYLKLEQNPNDNHLQKQLILLHKANISTIHAFCLEIIKNNFYEIDVSPNFRIAEQAECEILKQEVIEEIFEQKYEENNKEFIKLVDTYVDYRSDDDLKQIILNIYKFIQSNPFPKKWLEKKVEMFNTDKTLDFASTIWGKSILQQFGEEITDKIAGFKSIQNELKRFIELEKYVRSNTEKTYLN